MNFDIIFSLKSKINQLKDINNLFLNKMKVLYVCILVLVLYISASNAAK